MPGLLSSQPLLPAVEIVDHHHHHHHLHHSPCRRVSPPPSTMSLPLFRSPPLLSDPYAALPCSPSPRRRAKPLCTQTLRRRRQGSRVNYHSEPLPLHAFDKLPWIASLDVPPNDFAHPADIADLSTLPQVRPSGPGPIRRRKPSPRSSPLFAPASTLKTLPHPNNNDSDDSDDFFHHLSCNLFARNIPSRPSTPAPRIDVDPTRVTFRHLMPVSDSPSDDDDV